MTLYDILNDWDDASRQKKRQALQRILDFIDYEDNDPDQLMYDILEFVSNNYEGDDYFGTEGLEI